MHTPVYADPDHFPSPRNFLCTPSQSIPACTPLFWFFSEQISCAVLECPINGIIHIYTLCKIFPEYVFRLIHIVVSVACVFSLLSTTSNVMTIICLSFVDGHLFPPFDHYELNHYKSLCGYMFSFLLHIYFRVEWLVIAKVRVEFYKHFPKWKEMILS